MEEAGTAALWLRQTRLFLYGLRAGDIRIMKHGPDIAKGVDPVDHSPVGRSNDEQELQVGPLVFPDRHERFSARGKKERITR